MPRFNYGYVRFFKTLSPSLPQNVCGKRLEVLCSPGTKAPSIIELITIGTLPFAMHVSWPQSKEFVFHTPYLCTLSMIDAAIGQVGRHGSSLTGQGFFGKDPTVFTYIVHTYGSDLHMYVHANLNYVSISPYLFDA